MTDNVRATKIILNKLLNQKEKETLSFLINKILNPITESNYIEKEASRAIKKIENLKLPADAERQVIEKIYEEVYKKLGNVPKIEKNVIEKARLVLSQLLVIKKALNKSD